MALGRDSGLKRSLSLSEDTDFWNEALLGVVRDQQSIADFNAQLTYQAHKNEEEVGKSIPPTTQTKGLSVMKADENRHDDGTAAAAGLDDGPMKAWENEQQYMARLTLAKESMLLEHRQMSLPLVHQPPFSQLPLPSQVMEMERVADVWELHDAKVSRASDKHDNDYHIKFDNEYNAMKLRNDKQRHEALAMQRASDLLFEKPRVSTPPPPGEPSYRLWDWGQDGPLPSDYNPRVELQKLKQKILAKKREVDTLEPWLDSNGQVTIRAPRRKDQVNINVSDLHIAPRNHRTGVQYQYGVASGVGNQRSGQLSNGNTEENVDDRLRLKRARITSSTQSNAIPANTVQRQSPQRNNASGLQQSLTAPPKSSTSSQQHPSNSQQWSTTRQHPSYQSSLRTPGVMSTPQPQQQQHQVEEYIKSQTQAEGQHGEDESSTPPQIIPGKRAIASARACTKCRSSKKSCDMQRTVPHPCSHCVRMNRLCIEDLEYAENNKRRPGARGENGLEIDPALARAVANAKALSGTSSGGRKRKNRGSENNQNNHASSLSGRHAQQSFERQHMVATDVSVAGSTSHLTRLQCPGHASNDSAQSKSQQYPFQLQVVESSIGEYGSYGPSYIQSPRPEPINPNEDAWAGYTTNATHPNAVDYPTHPPFVGMSPLSNSFSQYANPSDRFSVVNQPMPQDSSALVDLAAIDRHNTQYQYGLDSTHEERVPLDSAFNTFNIQNGDDNVDLNIRNG